MRLRAGMRCVIGGLAKRSDLNGLEAALLSYGHTDEYLEAVVRIQSSMRGFLARRMLRGKEGATAAAAPPRARRS